MAAQRQYEEPARRLSSIGAVKRGLARMLPHDCPAGSAAVLAALDCEGGIRMSRLAELLATDMSVTSRHVAHGADRGWITRFPDPADRRSRILRLTPAGRNKLAELSERYVRTLAFRLADWSDDEVDQLNALLARLRDSFGDRRAASRLPGAAEPAGPTTRTPAQEPAQE